MSDTKPHVTVTTRVGFWEVVKTIGEGLVWLGIVAVWCQSCKSCRPIWPSECQHAPVEQEGK